MQQMQEPPQGVGAIRSRRRPPRRRTAVTVPDWTAEDLEAILASHQEAMTARIERGIRALHQTAVRLMSELARDEGVPAEDAQRALLAHVDERYQALTLRIERLEGALRQLVQTFKKGVAGDGAPTSDHLAQRVDAMAEAIDRLAAQQRQELQAFTRHTGQGLARIAARTGEELARMAQRQEAGLDRKLDDMRMAIDGLGNGGGSHLEDDTSAGPERAASVFVERLRSAEQRLATVTEEVDRWDPFRGTAGEESQGNPA